MRLCSAFLLSVLLFGSAACKKASLLEGRWRGSRVEVPPQLLRQVYQHATQYAGDVELIAKGSTITVGMQNRSHSSAFTIQKEEGGQVVILLPGGETETFTFVSENTMRWIVADGASIVFQRQKQ